MFTGWGAISCGPTPTPCWLQAVNLFWGGVVGEFSAIWLSCVRKLAFRFILRGGKDKHKLDNTQDLMSAGTQGVYAESHCFEQTFQSRAPVTTTEISRRLYPVRHDYVCLGWQGEVPGLFSGGSSDFD